MGKKLNDEDKTVRMQDRELMYSLFTKQSGYQPQSFLECIQGNATGSRFLMANERLLIGRSRECHICLHDVHVSGKHAVIYPEQDQYTVEDLESANGVYLNGKRIRRAVLAHNDQVQVGQCVFKVKLARSPR